MERPEEVKPAEGRSEAGRSVARCNLLVKRTTVVAVTAEGGRAWDLSTVVVRLGWEVRTGRRIAEIVLVAGTISRGAVTALVAAL